jgi:hypothetical protein
MVYKDNIKIFNGNIKSKIFKFERYKNRQIPTTLLIWPYSESKEWLLSTRFNINENK